jgi:hypothetical protein
MVESISATSKRLRRPSTGWISLSIGASAGIASMAACACASA